MAPVRDQVLFRLASTLCQLSARSCSNLPSRRACLSTAALPVRPSVTQPLRASETVMNVFDRKAKELQRDRAAAQEDVGVYDYLRSEAGYRLADRIKDVSRKFDKALDIGCGRGQVAEHIYCDMVGRLYQTELSKGFLDQSKSSPEAETVKMHLDEELPLPFEDNEMDLVVSSLNLHWVNNLPGLLQQIHRILKPDGCFIAAMFGGETLFELRCSLQLAETEREGGFAPHISPFTSIRDVGNLLNRAGFNLLTIDVDTIVVSYPTMFELMWDLKGMAENNAAWSRKVHLHRDSLLAAASIYRESYGNKDGSVPATFEILFMIGWKPHSSQAPPAERGSGEFSLKDLKNLPALTKKKPVPVIQSDKQDQLSKTK
ncbi:hypothetical protein RvY_07754-2 [Ramazzottius varieornatus]|nr:hypothetical protein RvY_07754-2 [Ramazzottius varieornatus]